MPRLTTLVAPRIVRRIVALARGDSASARLARDYAAAYGADLGSLLAEPTRAEPTRVEPPRDESPRSIPLLVAPVRLAIDLAPARAPRSRRAQILRRISRLAPDATVESSENRLLVTLPPGFEAEPLRTRLASNTDVVAVPVDAAQLAVSDARVG